MFLMHPIYGICIKSERWSAGKWSRYILISGWHTFSFGPCSSLTCIRWRRRHSWPRRHPLWWRCSCANVPPACLWILWCGIWPGRQMSVWFSRTIAGCVSIAAFILLCAGKTTPRFFSSRTSAWSLLISCCVSSIVAREHPPLAILAIFMAWRMSDYSSCTRPPCLAIVADMFKTYSKLVAASKVRFRYNLNHIQLRNLH